MDVNKNIYNTKESIKGLVDVDKNEIKRYNVKPNDLFFTRTSETSDEIGLTSAYTGELMDCVFSGFILRARPIKEDINSLFFAYYLRSDKSRSNIIKYSSITTRALISGSNLYKMKVRMPKIDEQNKIAGFLSAIDKKIELLEKKLVLYRELELTIKKNIFNNFKNCSFVKLNQICSIKKGKQLNKSDMVENGGYYVLNGGKEPSGHTNSWNVKENTITISEGGNSCGFVSFNHEKFYCGGHCYYLTLKEDNLDLNCLFHYLKFIEPKIMSLRVGSGLPNIQKGDIENIRILEIDYEKQKELGIFFESIDKKISFICKEKEGLKNFKRGLLQKMFI